MRSFQEKQGKMPPKTDKTKKCPFCGRKKGRYIYVGKYPKVDHVSGDKIIDYCCTKCQHNAKYLEKFDVDVAARLGHKVPTADDL